MKMFSIKKLCSLLALATVGSLAIACTSSTGSGSGTAATDTTAADVAATGDTATTTDTGTTAGDAAKTDTATTGTDGTAAGDTMTTGDTATTGDTMTTADTMPAGDKGCLSAADQAFLGELAKDNAKATKFGDDIKNCGLPQASEPDQDKAAAKIGDCVVSKGNAVSNKCAACYGIRAYCTIKNCVMNPAESATAKCVAEPTGEPCTACGTKYKCVEMSDNCKKGM